MAIEWMAAIKVAETGLKLYSMAGRSGSGVGKLLRAQTEMLNELAVQLTAISGQLEEIYNNIQDLRDTVHRLPEQTALATVSIYLRGRIGSASNLFREYALERDEHGQEYARVSVESRAESLARDIEVEREAIFRDGSVLLCPVTCAAWFVELNLLTSCTIFRRNRIRILARRYEGILSLWLENEIAPVLVNCNRVLLEMHSEIQKSYEAENSKCYTSIHVSRRELPSPRSYIYDTTVHAIENSLSHKPSPLRLRLRSYVIELDTLSSLGIPTSPVYWTLQPIQWFHHTKPVSYTQTAHSHRGPSAAAIEQEWKRSECRPNDSLPKFVTTVSNREADIERVYALTVMYAHFSLMVGATLESVRGVLKRADEL
jgi:hypothetical protein